MGIRLTTILLLLLWPSTGMAAGTLSGGQNQDTRSGASPTLTGTNFTGIPTGGLLDDAITPAKVDETGDYQMNNLTLTGELSTASTCNPVTYGAYFDGSSHPVADVSAISVLYDDDAWSGGDTYAQWARVVGSNGKIYLAHTAGGQAEDPTVDADHTYWVVLHEDGDEADTVYTQMCLSLYLKVTLSSGTAVLSASKPLYMYLDGQVLAGIGGNGTYDNYASKEAGTYLLKNSTTGDTVAMVGYGQELRDLYIGTYNKTTTAGTAITVNPQYIDPDSTNGARNNQVNNVMVSGAWNGLLLDGNVGFFTSMNLNIYEAYGTAIDLAASGAYGDSKFYNTWVENGSTQVKTQKTIANASKAIKYRSGEQFTFYSPKLYRTHHAVYVDADSGEHAWNLHLVEPSIEHQTGTPIAENAAMAGTAAWVYIHGGKISNHGSGISDYPAVNLSVTDRFIADDTVINSNSGGGVQLNNVGSSLNNVQFYWNTLLNDSDSDGTRDTCSNVDKYDIVLGADTSDTTITGSKFFDDIAGISDNCHYLSSHISISAGSDNYVILGNEYGTRDRAGASVIDAASDANSLICNNSYEEADGISLNCVEGASTELSDTANIVYEAEIDTIAELNTKLSDAELVAAPASSTDNAVALFDGTSGELLKNNQYITSDPATGYLTARRILGTAATGIAAGVFTTTAAGDGTSKNALVVKRDNTTTPTDNDGVLIGFQAYDDTSALANIATLQAVISDVSNGSEDSLFSIQTLLNGATVVPFSITPTSTNFNTSAGVKSAGFDRIDGALTAKDEEHIDADAHTLTCLEMSGGILNNDGQSADATWTVNDVDACNGIDFAFVASEELGADVDIFLDSNAANKFYLNGVAGTADQILCLEGTAGTEEMSTIGCLGVTNDGGVDITCYSAGPGTWHLDPDTTNCDGS